MDLADQWNQVNRHGMIDLITNQHTRDTFSLFAVKLVSGIRNSSNANALLEVETPMLQVYPAGANSQTFCNHSLMLWDIGLCIYVSHQELVFKALSVSVCFERVFEHKPEISEMKVYSTRHNPEFTMFRVLSVLMLIIMIDGLNWGKCCDRWL